MSGEHAVVFATLDRGHDIRIWVAARVVDSSFYVKSTYLPLQLMKVSIHDVDPNHAGKHHFRLDFDREPARKAARAGGSWTAVGAQLPLYFHGRHVNKRRNEKKVRTKDAGMGPMANSSGLYLPAVNTGAHNLCQLAVELGGHVTPVWLLPLQNCSVLDEPKRLIGMTPVVRRVGNRAQRATHLFVRAAARRAPRYAREFLRGEGWQATAAELPAAPQCET